jgi:hypothetical protein
MARLFNVLGFDEGVQTCDCCDKANLKGTFGIEMIESGEIRYYGSVCVTRNTGYAKKELNAMQREYEAQQLAAAKTEYRTFAERSALDAKQSEARALGLLGRVFKDFCMAELEADMKVRVVVARKYKIGVFQL